MFNGTVIRIVKIAMIFHTKINEITLYILLKLPNFPAKTMATHGTKYVGILKFDLYFIKTYDLHILYFHIVKKI